MNKTEYRIIADFNELATYKNAWNQLLKNSDADPLFMSFEWISVWWQTFGKKYKLNCYLLYQKKVLFGIFPLIIRKKDGFRQLTLMGVNKSDYTDFIFHKNYLQECIVFFFRDILSKSSGWDLFINSKVVKTKISNSFFLASLTENYKIKIVNFSTAPYLDLSTNWEDYYHNLPTKFKSDTNRQIKRIERELGAISYEFVQDSDKIEKALEILADYHKVRRNIHKKDHSMFNDSRNLAFYKKICLVMNCKNIHFSILRANNQIISMHLGFISGGRYYYLLPVIDMKFQKYSPGRILLLYLIENAFKSSCSKFDFCYGDEVYKTIFSSGRDILNEIIIVRDNIKGRIAFLWFSRFRIWFKDNRLFMKRIYPFLRKWSIIKEGS